MSEELQKAQIRVSALNGAISLYCCLRKQGGAGEGEMSGPLSIEDIHETWEGSRQALEFLFRELLQVAGVDHLV